MTRIGARVAGIAESATLAVDAKARALRAAGVDVVGFGAGEPDFPTPEPIVEAAERACRDPRFHHYSATGGLPELRSAIADKTLRDSGYPVEPSQVLVTNGAKHAIRNALTTLLDPGDEVLLPSPYWVSYPEAVELADGVVVAVPTDAASGFVASVEQLEAARTPRTKALIFVSPSNPTGAVYPPQDVAGIGRWAAEHGLWVITDEIYEHLVYGGAVFSSMPTLVPELADRCVVVNGVAKSYAMTGWRVGWMIGPPDVVAAATSLQSHTTSNVAGVAQAAALAALTGSQESVGAMRAAFDVRRRRMYAALTELPGVRCVEPHGAFYTFPSVAGLLGREVRGRRPATAVELAELLLDEARVAVVPGDGFGAPGHVRLSYALADADLDRGLSRLAELLGEVSAAPLEPELDEPRDEVGIRQA